jgi:hypothetical protein
MVLQVFVGDDSDQNGEKQKLVFHWMNSSGSEVERQAFYSQ